MNAFSIYVRFLAQIEYQSDRFAWTRACRLRDETRNTHLEHIKDEEKKLWLLISRSSSFLDYCVKKGELTEKGADDCAAFLLTSSRRVLRESNEEAGWAPSTTRRINAEKIFAASRPKNWARKLMREVA